ncbi:MAG: hypothetical protein R2818_03895 [Flavobacteriales bacterium]
MQERHRRQRWNRDIYEAVGSWDNLIGCLNGTWQFRATDLWAIDSHFLARGISISTLRLMVIPSFSYLLLTRLRLHFLERAGHHRSGSFVQPVVRPSVPGVLEYTYTAMNDFGCTFESSIISPVLRPPTRTAYRSAPKAQAWTRCAYFKVPVRDVLQVKTPSPYRGMNCSDLRGRRFGGSQRFDPITLCGYERFLRASTCSAGNTRGQSLCGW